LLTSLPLRFQPGTERLGVILAGREVGEEIRTPEISRLSSRLAVRPEVRELVTSLLRAAREAGPMVVEGRDIGTVVFPDATLKVFLRADLSVRAGRRREDLRRQGIEQSEDQVAREMAERDERDAGRAEAPLRQPEGALVVDTSGLAVEQEVEIIVQAYRRALSGQSPNGAGAGPSPVE
jgi:cytidylate kinase